VTEIITDLALDWLAKQRALWERRLDQLDNYITSLKNKKR